MYLADDVLVNIIIPTYNHEQFIAKAIDSALSQETEYSFNIIIGDDCSKDDTIQICHKFKKNHPDKIKLLYSSVNQGLVKNYRNIINDCKGKYIAILEGDDYWIDNTKIQQQVEILEANPNIGLVHTDYDLLFEDGFYLKSKNRFRNLHEVRGEVFEKLFQGNFIGACTVCFRNEVFKDLINLEEYQTLNAQTLDGFLWIEIASKYHFDYVKSSTAVHRILNDSISNNADYKKKKNFVLSNKSVLVYFWEKYKPDGVTLLEIENRLSRNLFFLALKYRNIDEVRTILPTQDKKDFLFSLMRRFIKYNVAIWILIFFYNKISIIKKYFHNSKLLNLIIK